MEVRWEHLAVDHSEGHTLGDAADVFDVELGLDARRRPVAADDRVDAHVDLARLREAFDVLWLKVLALELGCWVWGGAGGVSGSDRVAEREGAAKRGKRSHPSIRFQVGQAKRPRSSAKRSNGGCSPTAIVPMSLVESLTGTL